MISSDEIKKMGLLARIEITSHEAQEIQKDLEAILSYVSKLKQAPPSSETRPLKEIEVSKILTNVFRNDEPVEDKSDVKKGEHIKVKHIL